MKKKEIGFFGEKIAERYLENKGYKVLGRNYSFRIPGSPQSGEIDIVAKKGNIISFIEVKTLKDLSSWRPEEKVNSRKKRKIIKTAESWLMRKEIPFDSKWQIEVVSIKINFDLKKAKIRHFQRVFF